MLGETVLKLRKDRGWTQVDLAEVSGVSQPAISAIEKNTQRNLRMSTVYALARAALAGQAESSRRMALLGELLPELEGRLGSVDAGEANRWLRQVFRAIYLVDGAVVGVDV